jgi:hypothetical protein
MTPGPTTSRPPDEEDTWTDHSPARARRDVDLGAQQRHENWMQARALVGVGLLLLATTLIVVAAPWVGAISESFARDLAQMIIPALLAAAGTIVGTLFKG